MAAENENFITGLDIGTSKVCAVVGVIKDDSIEIIGLGQAKSYGLRRGVIVNIEGTVKSIQEAIKEAESMSGIKINSVFTGIAGSHIKGFNSEGVIAVKGDEITQSDIERVIDAARAVAIPADREVLHIIPQDFIVDGQDGIKDPVGMSAVRLEAKVHIITGAVASAQNIVKACNRAGLDVRDIIIEQLASAEAVLNDDEKELGVAIVDVGAGTTDIAVFQNDTIIHTGVITIAGDHITNDIAVGLRTPIESAEKIKIEHGCALKSLIEEEEIIKVPGIGGRTPQEIPKTLLTDIIEPRVEELFMLVKREIMKSGIYDSLASGIVLTGGTAIMEGMVELGESIFEMPVRRGFPKIRHGLADLVNSPMYATSVGLLLFGAKNIKKNIFPKKEKDTFDNVLNRMKKWFKEFF